MKEEKIHFCNMKDARKWQLTGTKVKKHEEFCGYFSKPKRGEFQYTFPKSSSRPHFESPLGGSSLFTAVFKEKMVIPLNTVLASSSGRTGFSVPAFPCVLHPAIGRNLTWASHPRE